MTGYRGRTINKVAGFTLLEALVATALMGMILAAVATITGQWLPNWNRGFARVQRNEQLALGLERLVTDLAAAEFIAAGRDTSQPLFEGAPLSATFVRTALGPGAGPGLEIVRLAEVRSEDGPVLIRTRAPFEPARKDARDRDQRRFTDPVVLMRSPYRISFSYAGPDRIWRDIWQRETQLPKAIKLTLRDATTRRTLTVSTATMIHAEAPADCISAHSLADCAASLQQPPGSSQSDKPREPAAGPVR